MSLKSIPQVRSVLDMLGILGLHPSSFPCPAWYPRRLTWTISCSVVLCLPVGLEAPLGGREVLCLGVHCRAPSWQMSQGQLFPSKEDRASVRVPL